MVAFVDTNGEFCCFVPNFVRFNLVHLFKRLLLKLGAVM